MKKRQIFLSQDEMPLQWYNILADIKINPPLGPDGNPIGPEQLAPVFPMNLIEQEVSTQRWIDIPEDVLDVLSIWRPAPMVRAYNLEKALGTPARIYFKNESVSPPGSHKPNTAVPQAYYNKIFGIKKMTTETGAGQWGSALSFACSHFGIECKVFMVRISFDQKPYRKTMMATWGGNCVPSPSMETKAGQEALEKDPNTPGTLGIAISEAIEAAVSDETGQTRYSLGSVLNHVMLHQTIIGLEAKKQLKKVGEYPDVIIGCAGGGSNFAGLAFPFVLDKINGRHIDIYPVEPAGCPTLTRAPFVYDHGDTAKYTPMLPMYSLGHAFVPPPIHSGGLRYHGMAPTVSQLVNEGICEAKSVTQGKAYAAGVLLARTEGIIPAPETNHALAAVVDEAIKAKEEGKEKVILFNWSGHGLLDLSAYEAFLSGNLKEDIELSDDLLAASEKVYADYPEARQPEEPVNAEKKHSPVRRRNMADRFDEHQDPMEMKRRCPRLGHDIGFGYCLESGEDDFPCWKIFDCWWEIFDVEAYLKARLPEGEYRKLAQKKPKPKVASILEIVEAAKKRTGKGSE